MSYSLYPYQCAGVEALSRAFLHHRRVCGVAPTGSGKTIIATEIMRRAVARGHRVLFLVHRHELILQTAAKLRESGLEFGFIKSGAPEDRRHAIQLASVQTLIRRERPPADLVICDEAHRNDYAKVTLKYDKAWILGLTATPVRMGGQGMGNEYEELVEIAKPKFLVEAGYIVPPHIWAPDTPDLRFAKVRCGDYTEDDLVKVMGQQALVGNIVDQWAAHARGTRTIVFAVNIAHATQLTEAFKNSGLFSVGIITSETADAERDILIARFRRGSLDIMVNVGIFVEGLDVPGVQTVVMARPTKSLALYLQQAGRGCRKVDGKGHYNLLDHAGNTINHYPPTWDHEYTLDHGKKRSGRKGQVPIRQCRKCYYIWPANEDGMCPMCGWEQPPRKVRYEAGQLVEVTDEQASAVAVKVKEIISDREKERRRLWAIARRTGEANPFRYVEHGLDEYDRRRTSGKGPGGIIVPEPQDVW